MFKCATCEYTSERLHGVVGHQRVKRVAPCVLTQAYFPVLVRPTP